MTIVLARNWWAVGLRGVFTILFGLGAFLLPGITFAVLVLLFGGYALVDGVLAVVASVRAAERHERWWPVLLEGVAGILAGLLTFLWPGLTALLLLYLVAGWAIVTGILKIVAAIHLRRAIKGELILALNGIVSLLVGLFLVALPGPGILAAIWWIGGYAVFRGIMLIALAGRLRSHHLRDQRPGPAA